MTESVKRSDGTREWVSSFGMAVLIWKLSVELIAFSANAEFFLLEF